MDPTWTLEFLGVLVDSHMTISLSQEKVDKIKTQCQELLEKSFPPSSTSAAQDFITPANSGNDFQIFYRGTTESIKTDKGRATLMNTKSQSV